MEYVIVGGEIVDREIATVDIEDRGYQFGDGVYEVIRVYNGKMFTAKEHLNRLQESAEKISIQIPYQPSELEEMLKGLIEKNGLANGIIYMQFTRGTSPRNHAFPHNVAPTFVAYTRKVDRPVSSMQEGIKAIFIEDIRWLRCDIKSLNLLGNLLAKQKAVEAGCFEAIQHRGNIVTEGSSSNVAIVKNGTVITHPANNLILNGITRQKVKNFVFERPFFVGACVLGRTQDRQKGFGECEGRHGKQQEADAVNKVHVAKGKACNTRCWVGSNR